MAILEELEKEIQGITRQLISKYKPQKIILFGSAAKGSVTPDSDLDFLIVKDDVPYLGRDRMRQVRGLIEKHWAADFLVYRPEELEERMRLGDPFIKMVLSEGKVLYG